MSAKVRQRIEELLEPLERHDLLLRPTSARDLRACHRLVDRKELVEPFPCLFCHAAFWESLRRTDRPYRIIRSLSRAYPDIVFCGPTAACVHGLPVTLELLDQVHIRVSPCAHSGQDGRFVRHKARHSETRRVLGINVTSFEETLVDCLRTFPFPDALALCDAAMRQRTLGRAHIMGIIERYGKGRAGVAQARRVAQFADPRSESGGESIARGVMIEEGFVPPELQIRIPDILDPQTVYRVDGGWRLKNGHLLVWEFDGKEKYARFSGGSPIRKMMRERQREARLTALCEAVIRFDYATVREPGALAALLDAYGVPRVRV